MRAPLLIVALVALSACKGAGPEGAPGAEAEGDAHVQVPVESMHDVMQAKLVHTHALLEGIAIRSYEQIELNAIDLTDLSRTSDWQVHDTLAYGVMSDEFREITMALTERARQRDIEGVSTEYVRMVESCMRCHAYLREAGLYKDMPGPVSMR